MTSRRDRMHRALGFALERWTKACATPCTCSYGRRSHKTPEPPLLSCCEPCQRAERWRQMVHRLETASYADPVARAATCEALAWDPVDAAPRARVKPKRLDDVDRGRLSRDLQRVA